MSLQSQYVRYDQWMSEILKLESYVVQPTLIESDSWKGKSGAEWEWYQNLCESNSFAFAKVPVDETGQLLKLQEAGFYIVDTNISLHCSDLKQVNSKNPADPQISFCFADIEDREETAALAGTSFVYTRFHLDERVPNEKADEFKYKWVENFFYGKRGDHMVLAKMGDKIVGFLQIIDQDKGFLIDLIAVGREARRKGVAAGLISYAAQNLKGIESINVGTQIANVPSINLYERLGFIFSEAKYVLHYLNRN